MNNSMNNNEKIIQFDLHAWLMKVAFERFDTSLKDVSSADQPTESQPIDLPNGLRKGGYKIF